MVATGDEDGLHLVYERFAQRPSGMGLAAYAVDWAYTGESLADSGEAVERCRELDAEFDGLVHEPRWLTGSLVRANRFPPVDLRHRQR